MATKKSDKQSESSTPTTDAPPTEMAGSTEPDVPSPSEPPLEPDFELRKDDDQRRLEDQDPMTLLLEMRSSLEDLHYKMDRLSAEFSVMPKAHPGMSQDEFDAYCQMYPKGKVVVIEDFKHTAFSAVKNRELDPRQYRNLRSFIAVGLKLRASMES